MKKIRTNLVVGGNGGINLPLPAPSPVAVTHFEPVATGEPDERLHGAGMRAQPSPPLPPPLPPPPQQMSAPVGPPPPASEIPADFQGLVELAKRVSKSPPPHSDKAMIWATLAQAEAVNRLADLIEELVKFTRVQTVDLGASGEDEIPSELSVAIADGITMAAEHVAPKKGKKS